MSTSRSQSPERKAPRSPSRPEPAQRSKASAMSEEKKKAANKVALITYLYDAASQFMANTGQGKVITLKLPSGDKTYDRSRIKGLQKRIGQELKTVLMETCSAYYSIIKRPRTNTQGKETSGLKKVSILTDQVRDFMIESLSGNIFAILARKESLSREDNLSFITADTSDSSGRRTVELLLRTLGIKISDVLKESQKIANNDYESAKEAYETRLAKNSNAKENADVIKFEDMGFNGTVNLDEMSIQNMIRRYFEKYGTTLNTQTFATLMSVIQKLNEATNPCPVDYEHKYIPCSATFMKYFGEDSDSVLRVDGHVVDGPPKSSEKNQDYDRSKSFIANLMISAANVQEGSPDKPIPFKSMELKDGGEKINLIARTAFFKMYSKACTGVVVKNSADASKACNALRLAATALNKELNNYLKPEKDKRKKENDARKRKEKKENTPALVRTQRSTVTITKTRATPAKSKSSRSKKSSTKSQ
jgi:hypothetical protein